MEGSRLAFTLGRKDDASIRHLSLAPRQALCRRKMTKPATVALSRRGDAVLDKPLNVVVDGVIRVIPNLLADLLGDDLIGDFGTVSREHTNDVSTPERPQARQQGSVSGSS